ncbi:hypothetical protein RJ639_014870 [Escallonia herrerae]|uniref:MYB transcription factor n=1 Tax=Escallonia herrerae TaxID=1293975 RepID=A0AA88VHM3_9ASTE|nr:hypothetical protein RJ639_014870 [Escallonia herrerae]
MGRAPCCDKTKVKRGPWSPEEDATLKNYLEKHDTVGNWIALPQKAGLKRCGKSCRLRWLNYLRPDINHGAFTEEEDNKIWTLYTEMGSRQVNLSRLAINFPVLMACLDVSPPTPTPHTHKKEFDTKWSVIASQLPGRTDNDVKNHWNTKLKKKLMIMTLQESNQNSSTKHPLTPPSTAYFVPKLNDQAYTPAEKAFPTFLTQTSPATPSLADANYEPYWTFSPSQKAGCETSISRLSPSLAMDNINYAAWPGLQEELSMDFGTGLGYDLVDWPQETTSTIVEAAGPTNWFVDTKPGVLCENVTNN